VNNVEVIDIPEIAPGVFKLLVIAANVPESPQSFAVAISAQTAPEVPTSTEALHLNVDSLRGIGSVLAERLTARGLTRLDALAHLNEQQLGETLGIQGVCLARLRSRLILLDRTLAEPRPAAISPETTLADLERNSLPPAAVPVEQWNRARQALLPLTLVFKHQLLPQITLKHLFG
jgi:hypothetical protein